MVGVDLSTYVFDYDLTMAILLMNADGRIYHQYGNRDASGPESHLSMESLTRVMRGGLEDHAAYSPGKIGKAMKEHSVEELPTMAERVKSGKAPKCFHCHMVNQAHDELALRKKRFDPSVAWRWPGAKQVGIVVDRDDQSLVAEVFDGSTAAKAGLRAGDRLVTMGARRVRSEGDLQWVLENTSDRGASVPVTYDRGGETDRAVLKLAKGWREGDAKDLWRSSMWRLSPKPGFGGPPLKPAEKEKLGIDVESFAFRVNYIVTWGANSYTGRNAEKAGIRKNDIIVSVAGKSDFESMHHFHAWFRLTRKIGEKVPIEILRNGKAKTLTLKTVE